PRLAAFCLPRNLRKGATMDSPKIQLDWYPDKLRQKETEALRVRRRAVKLDPALSDIDDAAPQRDTLGVALSGGGIRSATFSLGLLQALAKAGLLLRIDYLSTVSGGGYIGAFLGRLFMRIREESPKEQNVDGRQQPSNAQDVEDLLKDSQTQPLCWLRENGRYLSPNGSGDLLLDVAVALRSWVAIHAVLAVFVLMQFLFYDLIRCGVSPLLPEWMTKSLESGIVWWSPYVWLPALLLVFFVIPIGGAYWLVPLPRTTMTGRARFTTSYLSKCIALAFGVTAGVLALVWMHQPSHEAAAYLSLL